MDDTGQRRPARIADRVGPLFGCGDQFGGARHELRGDRVVRIAGVDQRRDILGQRHGEAVGDAAQFVEPFRGRQAG